jgi:hypothetical protein
MRILHLAPLSLLLLSGLVVVPSAVAQPDLSPAERQAAAEAAYDRGTRAYRGGDYAQAARWYETANELAPAAAAALQAVRAHQRAGNFLRAATLVHFVGEEYGEERTQRFRRPLERAQEEGFTLTISCEECGELEVDGEREIFRTLYLPPDVTHTVVADFETGRVEEEVSGAAGESQELTLTAPEPEPDPVIPPTTGPTTNPSATPPPPIRDEGGGGISPAFFLSGLGLTAVAGGLAIWSWVDTLDAAADYEMAPTQEKLDNGRDLELRTTIFVIGTAALGAITLVLLPFTDWSGGPDDDEDEEATLRLDWLEVSPLPEGGAAIGAGGRF